MSFIRIVFCAFMVALAACSDEPIRTGPFHEVYHCDLTGDDYTNPGDYDHFCTEEFAELLREYDSIQKNVIDETYIEKDCKIDEIRFLSKFWETFGTFQIEIYKTSYSITVTGANHGDSYVKWYSIDVFSAYECSGSLDSEKIEVLKEPDCNDSLTIKSIIDFFDKQPDEKCIQRK